MRATLGSEQFNPRGDQYPAQRFFIPVQGSAVDSIRIISHYTETIPWDESGAFPRQLDAAPRVAENGLSRPAPLCSTSTTGQTSLYPSNTLAVLRVGILRGINLAVVEFHPVQFDPEVQELYRHLELEFEIHTSPSQPHYLTPLSPAFRRILAYLCPEPAMTEQLHYSWYDRDHLLFITPDIYSGTIAPLINWKRQKGFEVTVAQLSEIGTAAEDIQTYIRNAYTSWPRPPSHLLLVGDTDLIPTFTGEHYPDSTAAEYPTDLYYGTMDGTDDFVPDILTGRLSVKNEEELAGIVEKIIAFELPDTTDMSWMDRGTFIATGNETYHDLVEESHRYAINNYFTSQDLTADSIWISTGGNIDDIRNSVNAGTRVVCYSGHGTPYSWEDSAFTIQDPYYLTNADAPPVVLSFGCTAGNYDTTGYSLGEAWLTAINQTPVGAVSFWGATNFSYWFEDDYLERRFWDAAFSGQIYSLGEMTLASLLEVWSRGYPTGDYYFENYNLLGDPTLDFRIGQPALLQVEYPISLSDSTSQLVLKVTGNPGAVIEGWASICSGDSILTQGVVSGGNALLSLGSSLAGIDSATLTIVAPDYRTFQGPINVVNNAILTIDPAQLPIGKDTSVTITVTELDSSPLVNCLVDLSGLGIADGLIDTSDEQGIVRFTLSPAFGENLTVRTYDLQGLPLIEGQLPVLDGQSFIADTLTAGSSLLGTPDFLVPGFPGEIDWSTIPDSATLFVSGSGIDTSSTSSPLTVIPSYEGILSGTLARAGYNILTCDIPVRPARGTLSGTVVDSSTLEPLAGQTILMFALRDTSISSVEVETDLAGAFQLPEAMPVGYYQVQARRFGYHAYQDTVLLKYGANSDSLRLIHLEQAQLAGTVRDSTSGNVLKDVVVWVRSQGLRDTTDEVGAFEISGIIPDTVVVTILKRGYSVKHATLNLGEGEILSSLAYALPTGPAEQIFRFELDDEDFSYSGDWQLGKPGIGLRRRGPATAYEGEQVMATVLDGDYSPLSNSVLETPDFYLNSFTHATFSFHHYYQTTSGSPLNVGFDGGNVEISSDGGQNWQIIYPVEDYPVGSVTALASQPGFSGDQAEWRLVQFSLDEFLGSADSIRLRFHFASTEMVEDAGWYLDYATLSNSLPLTVISGRPSLPARFTLHQNYPNPFNPATIICFDLPITCDGVLIIYDLLGREIIRLTEGYLTAGFHQVIWQGQDAHGRQVPSGLYLARMIIPGQSRSIKLLLLR